MKRKDFVYISIIFALLFVLVHIGCISGYFHGFFVAYSLVQEEPVETGYQTRLVTLMERSAERSWENCLRQMNIHFDVVFYGNSITRNGSFSSYFPNTSICNLGHGGDDIDGMKRRIGMATCLSPKVVFLMAGINDQADKIPIDIFEQKYRDLITSLIDSLPDTELYIQSILPVNSKVYESFGTNEHINSCNQIIKKIAEDASLEYIDLYSLYIKDGELPLSYTKDSDGLHLAPEKYYVWVNRIAPIIYSKCNSTL